MLVLLTTYFPHLINFLWEWFKAFLFTDLSNHPGEKHSVELLRANVHMGGFAGALLCIQEAECVGWVSKNNLSI